MLKLLEYRRCVRTQKDTAWLSQLPAVYTFLERYGRVFWHLKFFTAVGVDDVSARDRPSLL